MHKRLSDYTDFKQENRIKANTSISWRCAEYVLYHPIAYYKSGDVFPPCDNWREGDPINLAPFLIFNGWGTGKTSVPNYENNQYPCLVIIVYELNGKIHKKCTNIFSYNLNCVQTRVDVFTNKKVTTSSILKVFNLMKQQSEKLSENYVNNLIPEIKIEFDHLSNE